MIAPFFSLLMSNLRKEAAYQGLADCKMQFAFVIDGNKLYFKSLHGAFQLLPDVVRLCKSSCVQEIVPCPIFVILIWQKIIHVRYSSIYHPDELTLCIIIVNIQESQMIAIRYGQQSLCSICS